MYKQSEAYQVCKKIQVSKSKKEESFSEFLNTLMNGYQTVDCNGFTIYDVPIFTDELFYENKTHEAELRFLRKTQV